MRKIIAFGLVLMLTACTLPRNVVVLVPNEDGAVGRVTVSKAGVQQELSGSYAAVGTTTAAQYEHVFVANPKDVQAAFAGALAAKPRPPTIYIIYFLTGTAEIDPASTNTLARAVAAARATENADISVVGHSDATGDDAGNMTLSRKRAQAVDDALVQGGVKASIIEVGYDGSNNPLIPTPRGVPEKRNRRVEVTIR